MYKQCPLYITFIHFDYVLEMLTGFHRNIKFTYEVEADSKISFLDVLVMCDSSNNINTTAYWKSTNNDICLNWESFTRHKWKGGTLKILTMASRTWVLAILPIGNRSTNLKIWSYYENLEHTHARYTETTLVI